MARTTLGVGETQATSYTLSRGSLGSVRYTSSNSGIAQVDAEGNVTGLRPGKCTITIRTHNGRTARVKITIVAAPTSVSFASTEMTMGTDQVARLGCKIQPVAVGSVRYTSSNPAVISIDEAAGTATAVGLGTAVVTAETYNHVVGSCTVTVLRGAGQREPVDGAHGIGARRKNGHRSRLPARGRFWRCNVRHL